MRFRTGSKFFVPALMGCWLATGGSALAQKAVTASDDPIAKVLKKKKTTDIAGKAVTTVKPKPKVVDRGIPNEVPLPARKLFGYLQSPAPMKASSYGGYAKGCMSGAEEMPINGLAWQVMRLSRNRNWGHPVLIDYLKKLAVDVQQKDGWPGLLIGDISQPRGGPMLTGHKSHQLGLDADIWMRSMPSRRLTYKEREETAAPSMLSGKISISKTRFKPGNVKVLRRAASSPLVARIFVHPAIKKAVCEATNDDPKRESWLKKIRPWWGHHYHFHVRLKCPRGSRGCKNQRPVPKGDGCGKPINDWFAMMTRPPRKPAKPAVKPTKPRKPRKKRYLTLAKLPKSCRRVLSYGRHKNAMLFAKGVGENVTLPVRRPVN